MSQDGGQVPDTTPTQPERSDGTVDDAVDRAAAGQEGGGTLRDPEHSTPGSAPVEQVTDDEDMTHGRAVSDGTTSAEAGVAEPTVPPEEAAVSGGAQSDPGARASDRTVAADDD